MFTLDTDPVRRLVRVRMTGFLSPEDVAAFSKEEQAVVRAMGCRDGEFLLLVDANDAVIQSQETVAAFMGIATHSELKAKRMAVVRGSSLTRMQAQRILLVRDNAAIFASAEEAEAWLMAG